MEFVFRLTFGEKRRTVTKFHIPAELKIPTGTHCGKHEIPTYDQRVDEPCW
jgi:hypothetical protein